LEPNNESNFRTKKYSLEERRKSLKIKEQGRKKEGRKKERKKERKRGKGSL
jgi:hypothetical protein